MQKGRSLRLPQAKEGSGLFIRIIRRIFALSADNSELTRVGRSGSVLFDDSFFLHVTKQPVQIGRSDRLFHIEPFQDGPEQIIP